MSKLSIYIIVSSTIILPLRFLCYHRQNLESAINILTVLTLILVGLVTLYVDDDAKLKRTSPEGIFDKFFAICENLINKLFGYGDAEFKLESVSEIFEVISNLNLEKFRHLKYLKLLREHIKSNNVSIRNLTEAGVIQRLLITTTDMSVEDLRKSLSFEIINHFISSEEFKTVTKDNDDILSDIVINLRKAVSFLTEGFDISTIDLDDFQDDNIISFADEEQKKIKKRSDRCHVLERSSSHKVIMTIGLLGSLSSRSQSLLGDRGLIEIILGCLKDCKESAVLTKWSLWSLIHLTYKHPPNKRDFFVQNGIALTVISLHHHVDSLEVVQQGFALLYSILSPEPKINVNLFTARSQALANGLVDLLYVVEKRYHTCKDLMTTTNAIQKDIFQDWTM